MSLLAYAWLRKGFAVVQRVCEHFPAAQPCAEKEKVLCEFSRTLEFSFEKRPSKRRQGSVSGLPARPVGGVGLPEGGGRAERWS